MQPEHFAKLKISSCGRAHFISAPDIFLEDNSKSDFMLNFAHCNFQVYDASTVKGLEV